MLVVGAMKVSSDDDDDDDSDIDDADDDDDVTGVEGDGSTLPCWSSQPWQRHPVKN